MKRAPDSELRAKNEDERGSVARERGVCFMLGPLTFDRIQPELLYKRSRAEENPFLSGIMKFGV